jgi:short-subunit dehydrogenase
MSAAPYAGKSIVLTGASSGIGRALALALAAQRPRLALAARDTEMLADVADECRAMGAEAVVVPTDVSDPAAAAFLIETAASAFGGIDVLVNNAGISMMARFDEVTDLTLFETLMRVNYLGCVYLSHHALPHPKASRGQIVAMASLAGLTGVPTRTGYAASKHAVIGFYDSLRVELEGTDVRLTLVAPGPVETAMWDRIDIEGSYQMPALRRFRRLGFLPRLTAEQVATATVAAVIDDRPYVRLPRRYAAYHVLNNAPRRMVRAALVGVKLPSPSPT